MRMGVLIPWSRRRGSYKERRGQRRDWVCAETDGFLVMAWMAPHGVIELEPMFAEQLLMPD